MYVSERQGQNVAQSVQITNDGTKDFTHIIYFPCTTSHIRVALLMQLPLNSFQMKINACFRERKNIGQDVTRPLQMMINDGTSD